ncbi:MAG: hypothetical protein IH987_17765 [Planctomycetes bacterium]|nr:hypothetical protein [Planctomycetota bacterium]
MKTRNCATILAAVFVFCGVADARPPDYAITFNLHETIGDPTSDIEFTVTMGLMKEEQNGDDIGWQVQIVTIRELDDNGNVIDTWFKTQPNVDTSDELWWIEHADPDNPVNSEFLIPPLIYGTAGHVNTTEPSLEFEFEGDLYVAPPGGPPFDDTASLTTLLQEPGNPPPPPKKNETDEPVESDPEPESPFPI